MLRLKLPPILGFTTPIELDALPLKPVGGGSSQITKGGKSGDHVAELEVVGQTELDF